MGEILQSLVWPGEPIALFVFLGISYPPHLSL
jgi:hypothetical protein